MGARLLSVRLLLAGTTVVLPVGLALADLLGVDPGFPLLIHDNAGGTSYDATTNEYLIVSDAISIQFTPQTPPRPVVPARGERFVRLRILVDNDGTLIGGPIGPDLQIVGAVDADGDGTIDYEGSLITGEILEFGFLDGPAFGDMKSSPSVSGGNDDFDFRFRLTGGVMAPLYAGFDVGVVNTSTMSTFEDFTTDFFGDAGGTVGPIPPIGACCLADGSCEDGVAQGVCEDGGGFFGGRGSLCKATECPGACCLPDESCTIVTRTECAAGDGDYQGEGTTCDDVSCAPVRGACCFDDGSCQVLTQDGCRDAGGAYQGNDTACIPGLCPPPEGACCFRNGACFVLMEDDCEDQGGVYTGDDTICDPDLCPPPKGACCFPDGGCSVIRQELCGILGGDYQGDGSACTPGRCDLPTGACCFPDGSCVVLEQAVCNESGGAYQGSGTECTPELCPQPEGACCLDNSVCLILTRTDCDDAGGDYRGDGSDCETEVCAERGACCLPDGTCRFVLPSECETLGGDFRGEGVPCTPDTLGEPGRYRLGNHPDGNRAPPGYGLRLDELFDVTGETDVFTFDFDAPGTEMLLDFDGTSIRIHGTAFGGLDIGDDYDPDWVSFVDIDFTYDVVETATGDDDLIVITPSGSNSGTVAWLETGEVMVLEDKASDRDFTFRFGDEDDDAGHRDSPGLSGWGWLMFADGPRDGTRDWIFTARGICAPGGGGACCLPGGVCVILEADPCDESGGEFQGAGTTCEPGTCGADEGACCFPDEDCPTGEFECERKIVRMTMIWDGGEPVRIRAYNGDTDDELLADIDNIQVGDEVTIGPLDGPNNVYWEVFRAGTSHLIGLSEFHRSCSDRDMNGPEDCGKRQGNGKRNRDDRINDWRLEGLLDGDGDSFDCGGSGGGSGNCMVLAEEACDAAGGTFRGGGTTCDDVDCVDPVGACCLDDDDDDDDDCVDVSLFCCEAVGGLYLGDGTRCATSECDD